MAPRVGKNGKIFTMVKLRSMIISDGKGAESTSKNDPRITPVGELIRKYKLDEFTQLWNVLVGDMSLVGPRPNTNLGVSVYTDKEMQLLDVKPGITDFSSIVFSDEGEILAKSPDPDKDYDRLIRPWKSRLGLIYIENVTFFLDIKLIFYTLIAIFSKEKALNWLVNYLTFLNVDEEIIVISTRKRDLYEIPPPSSKAQALR
tara:strand:+ start:7464 stop:8069 length:606 start_codon:yes stop_codon:yes gene_type:complete